MHIGQILEQARVELVALVGAVTAHLLQETTNLLLVDQVEQTQVEVVEAALTHLNQLVRVQQAAQAVQVSL